MPTSYGVWHPQRQAPPTVPWPDRAPDCAAWQSAYHRRRTLVPGAMTMKRMTLAVLGLVMAAGCSKPATIDKKDASVEEVGKAIADSGAATHFQPGRWETRVDLKN